VHSPVHSIFAFANSCTQVASFDCISPSTHPLLATQAVAYPSKHLSGTDALSLKLPPSSYPCLPILSRTSEDATGPSDAPLSLGRGIHRGTEDNLPDSLWGKEVSNAYNRVFFTHPRCTGDHSRFPGNLVRRHPSRTISSTSEARPEGLGLATQ